MAVNLTKPPRMREYTPVHLIDEEESIMRNSRGVPARSIEVPVVCTGTENLPAVAQKNELGAGMDTLLEGIESADDDTREKFMNEFLRAANKKRRKFSKRNFACFADSFMPLIFGGILSIALLLLGLFLPSIATQVISQQPTMDADTTSYILEIVKTTQIFFLMVSAGTMLALGLSAIRGIIGRIL